MKQMGNNDKYEETKSKIKSEETNMKNEYEETNMKKRQI
jgi:hypothetical protein